MTSCVLTSGSPTRKRGSVLIRSLAYASGSQWAQLVIRPHPSPLPEGEGAKRNPRYTHPSARYAAIMRSTTPHRPLLLTSFLLASVIASAHAADPAPKPAAPADSKEKPGAMKPIKDDPNLPRVLLIG